MDQTMQKMIMTVPNFYIFPSWFLTAGWELNSMLLQEKSASFQTNQVERENHKPRPTSIQCSSIIFMHFFLLFAKLGGWNCKVSRISWLPSKLIGLLQVYTLYWREGITARVRRSWSPKLLALVTSTSAWHGAQNDSWRSQKAKAESK